MRDWSNYIYYYDDFILKAFRKLTNVNLHTQKSVITISDYGLHSFFYFTRPNDGGIFDLTVKEFLKKVPNNDVLKIYMAFMLYFSDDENKKKYEETYGLIKNSLKMDSFVKVKKGEKEYKVKIGTLFSKVESGEITAKDLFGSEDDERFVNFF